MEDQSSDKLSKSFRVHSNYLEAMLLLAGFKSTKSSTDVLTDIAHQVLTGPVDRQVAQVNETEVVSCLSRAWGTELLLVMNMEFSNEDEIIKLANTWGTVQAYYVMYGMTQSLHVSGGNKRPTSHTTTQKLFTEYWISRGFNIAPWTLGVGHSSLPGFGHTTIDDTISSLSSADHFNSWSLTAKAFNSTRMRKVSESLNNKRSYKLGERKKKFKESNNIREQNGLKRIPEPTWPKYAQLSSTEKETTKKSVRIYTTIDYMYRLRIKSNYEDARMFTEGPEDEKSSINVAKNLILLSSATALIHEMRIMNIIGKNRFLDIAREWVKKNYIESVKNGLKERLDIYEAMHKN